MAPFGHNKSCFLIRHLRKLQRLAWWPPISMAPKWAEPRTTCFVHSRQIQVCARVMHRRADLGEMQSVSQNKCHHLVAFKQVPCRYFIWAENTGNFLFCTWIYSHAPCEPHITFESCHEEDGGNWTLNGSKWRGVLDPGFLISCEAGKKGGARVASEVLAAIFSDARMS